ncbi:hypothetical protein [Xanthomonas fragariae]|nr:hypothetical protein [Xanthomonas fragariae]SMQ96323.1 hypothetical protein NBC2815_03002 [Xanthomonas fragariae]
MAPAGAAFKPARPVGSGFALAYATAARVATSGIAELFSVRRMENLRV